MRIAKHHNLWRSGSRGSEGKTLPGVTFERHDEYIRLKIYAGLTDSLTDSQRID
jgi:hypothetical protein